jgi:DNA ligase-associated metallophosphoesterase
MAERLDLHLGGEPMQLLADRALFWPARRRLFIADLHLGKGDVFRRAGIALPSGGSRHDLDRLGALVAATGATAAWVLGDMLHGATDGRAWRESWDAWRSAQPSLEIVVLAGNHDRALAGAGLDVVLAGECVDDGPFALRHAPTLHPDLHVLCGHLHPGVPLPGFGHRRFPAFWLAAGCTVLPAFSAFTGGARPAPSDADTLVACTPGGLVRVPAVALVADTHSSRGRTARRP